MKNFSKFVKDSIGAINNVGGEFGAYKLPSNFYKLSHSKYLRDTDNKVSGITGASCSFKDYKNSKETVWSYMQDDFVVEPDTFVFLWKCDNYTIHFIVKEIVDNNHVIGFTQEEMDSILNSDINKPIILFAFR